MADVAHLEKMGRELKCPICWSLLRSAVSISCNHVFCNSCILESMKTVSSCPVCKVPFRRREVRAAPHMDNLVSIFKSMEVATGTSILSTQLAPAAKNSDGAKQGDEENNVGVPETSVAHEGKEKNKKKKRRLCKANARNPVSRPSTKPSFPTKKRIHVTPFPISETPKRPKEALKLVDSCSEVKDDVKTDNCAVAPYENKGSPSLSPFFWLREEDDDENAERPSMEQTIDTPPSNNAPCFSDIKDSDDEAPCNMTPKSKSKSQEAFDSELFEWTQRACSPELCSTPQKKQSKGKQKLDQIQETDCRGIMEVGELCDDVCLTNAEPKEVDAGKGCSKNKKRNSITKKKSAKSSVCRNTHNIASDAHQEVSNNPSGMLQNSNDVCKNTDKISPPTVRGKYTHMNRHLLAHQNLNSDELPITLRDQAFAEPSDQLPAISMGVNDKNGEKGDSNILLKDRKRSKTSSSESQRKRIKETSDNVKDKITEGIPTGSVSKRKMGSKNSKKMRAVPEFLDYRGKDGKDSCDATAAKGTRIINGQKHGSKTCGRTARAKRMISAASMDSAVLRNNAVSERSDILFVRKLKKDGKSTATDCVLKKCENTPEVVCAFCKSAGITEDSGEMMHYFNGKLVATNYSRGTNVIHSHKNCTEWAPDVYFEDDSAINLAAELARSRRIKCIVCGIKGAALGCFEKSCRKSFHYTCAKLIPECRWDNENFVMLCPLHWSSKLPIETSEAQKRIKRTSSKGSISQVSSARDSGYDTSRFWSWPSGSPCKWVLCCSALSNKEKEIVSRFAKMTGVPISKTWSPAVTHVITSTDGSGACKRTLKFLMAILNGKWIVDIDWIRLCMEDMEPVDEEKFEITVDVHGVSSGPKLGRLKAINKEPKLFNGLRFYFSGDYVPSYRGYLQDLVTAAGGTVVQRKPISRDQQKLLDDSSLTFIIYSIERPEESDSNDNSVVPDLRRAEAKALADACGGKIASNTWVIDSIAACKLQPLI